MIKLKELSHCKEQASSFIADAVAIVVMADPLASDVWIEDASAPYDTVAGGIWGWEAVGYRLEHSCNRNAESGQVCSWNFGYSFATADSFRDCHWT